MSEILRGIYKFFTRDTESDLISDLVNGLQQRELGYNRGRKQFLYRDTDDTYVNLGPVFHYDSRSFTSFDNAISEIGAENCTLIVSEQVAVNSNITVPTNIHLFLTGAGSFDISVGFTLTLNGQLTAPFRKIFFGSGSATLGATANDQNIQQWWGGDRDSFIQIGQTKTANSRYFSLGIDESDSSKFKVSYGAAGAAPGTNDYLSIGIDGAVHVYNNQTIAGTLGVTGNTLLGGTLGVTGLTSLSTLNTSGLATLNSLSVTTTATITGVLTLTTNPVFNWLGATKIPFSHFDGSGNMTSSSLLTYDSSTQTFATQNGTFGGTVVATGLITASDGILINGGTGGSGRIVKSSTMGLLMNGVTGSTNDFALRSVANNTLMRVPTGTSTVEFSVDTTMASTLNVTGLQTNAGNLRFSTTDPEINKSNNTGRVIITSGTGNNTSLGALIRLEGADYGGVGSGGNITFGAPSTSKLMTIGLSLSVSGTASFSSSITQTGGTTSLSVDDNAATAFEVKQGSNGYIKVATTNSSELVTIGNATTNPSYTFLGSGTFTVAGAATMAGITSSADITVSKTAAANVPIITVTSSDNSSASSDARFQATVGGASAGDPFMRFTITGVQSWAIGPDNSDSDAFVISANGGLGTSNVLRATTAGAVSIPGSLEVTGRVGIGTSAPTNTGIDVAIVSVSSGTTQTGIISQMTHSSSATVNGKAFYAQVKTAVASYTMAGAIGLHVDTPSKGAGSTITTAYGIKIETQTAGGTNYAIHTGTGTVSLGDTLTFNANGSAANGSIWKSAGAGLSLRGIAGSSYDFSLFDTGGAYLLRNVTGTQQLEFPGSGSIAFTPAITMASTLAVTGNVGIGASSVASYTLNLNSSALTGTSQYGLVSQSTFTSASTTSGAAVYASLRTAVASFTMTSGIGVHIDSPTKGSGSTITTLYGLKVEDQTAGGTNYAIYTGSGTVRFGGNILMNGCITTSLSYTAAAYNAESSGGLYFQGNNGGTAIVRLAAPSNGSPYNYFAQNTILGTDATPSYKLDVRGTFGASGEARFTNSGSAVYVSTGFISLDGVASGVTASGGTTNCRIGWSTSSAFVLQTQGQNCFTVTASTGAIAFGSAVTASTTLAVTSTSVFTGGATFNGGITSVATAASSFYNTGTYTASATGLTGSSTGTFRWVKVGKLVTLHMVPLTGTSNSSGYTVTGMPSEIMPARAQILYNVLVRNNSLSYMGTVQIATDGVMQFGFIETISGGPNYTFTSSGGKGADSVQTISYLLD